MVVIDWTDGAGTVCPTMGREKYANPATLGALLLTDMVPRARDVATDKEPPSRATPEAARAREAVAGVAGADDPTPATGNPWADTAGNDNPVLSYALVDGVL